MTAEVKIRAITVDCAEPAKLAAFWVAALGGTVLADYSEYVLVDSPGGVQLGFQRVPEAAAGKNRLHLDLTVAPGTRLSTVARLVELGAEFRYESVGEVPGIDWSTLADPEGNLFCLGEH